jgi:hypothetical protein
MQANPQGVTQDKGCAAWSLLASLIAVRKFIEGQKCDLETSDFIIAQDLKQTLHLFMTYCVKQLYGLEAIYHKQKTNFEELKNTLLLSDATLPDDAILDHIFMENEGDIERCVDQCVFAV